MLGEVAARCGAGMEARWGDLERRLGGGLDPDPVVDPERVREACDMDWGLATVAELGVVGVAPR